MLHDELRSRDGNNKEGFRVIVNNQHFSLAAAIDG